MTPKQVLQRAQTETLTDKKGERVELVVAVGLSADEMAALERKRESPFPKEIRELLEYSRGFALRSKWTSSKFRDGGLTVELSGQDWTGYPGWAAPASPEAGPRGLELISDICGNPWVIDVSRQGAWGAVFYVSHDPPFIAYQANDLTSLLLELFLLFTGTHASQFIDPDVDKAQKIPLTKAAALRKSEDAALREFASTLKDDDLVADLREKKAGTGFAWNALGGDTIVKRHQTALLFGLTRPERKGFLRGMFGGS